LCGLCFSTSSVHLAAVRLQERAGIAADIASFEKQVTYFISEYRIIKAWAESESQKLEQALAMLGPNDQNQVDVSDILPEVLNHLNTEVFDPLNQLFQPKKGDELNLYNFIRGESYVDLTTLELIIKTWLTLSIIPTNAEKIFTIEELPPGRGSVEDEIKSIEKIVRTVNESVLLLPPTLPDTVSVNVDVQILMNQLIDLVDSVAKSSSPATNKELSDKNTVRAEVKLLLDELADSIDESKATTGESSTHEEKVREGIKTILNEVVSNAIDAAGQKSESNGEPVQLLSTDIPTTSKAPDICQSSLKDPEKDPLVLMTFSRLLFFVCRSSEICDDMKKLALDNKLTPLSLNHLTTYYFNSLKNKDRFTLLDQAIEQTKNTDDVVKFFSSAKILHLITIDSKLKKDVSSSLRNNFSLYPSKLNSLLDSLIEHLTFSNTEQEVNAENQLVSIFKECILQGKALPLFIDKIAIRLEKDQRSGLISLIQYTVNLATLEELAWTKPPTLSNLRKWGLIEPDAVYPKLKRENNPDGILQRLIRQCIKEQHGDFIELLLLTTLKRSHFEPVNGQVLMLFAKQGLIQGITQLIQDGEDLTRLDINSWSAFMHAAANGQSETVEFLSGNIPPQKLMQKDNEGLDAALLAIQGGHEDTLRTLIQYCPALITARKGENSGYSALIFAIRQKQNNCVKVIAEAFPDAICTPVTTTTSPLLQSLSPGHLDCFQQLLQILSKHNPVKRDFWNSPIFYQTLNCKNPEAARWMIQEHPDLIHYPHNSFEQPLSLSIIHDMDDLSHEMLKLEKVDINAVNTKGVTALMISSIKNKDNILLELVDRVELNAASKCHDGKSALHLAAFFGSFQCLRILTDRYPEQLWETDVNGNTALHALILGNAISRGAFDTAISSDGLTPSANDGAFENCLNLVLSNAIGRQQINKKSNHGLSPLMHAAQYGNKSIITELLKVGDIDINSQDHQGKTALMHAGAAGYMGAIQTLLEQDKTDVSITDVYGSSFLLHMARSEQFQAIIELLTTADESVHAKIQSIVNTPDSWGWTLATIAAFNDKTETFGLLQALYTVQLGAGEVRMKRRENGVLSVPPIFTPIWADSVELFDSMLSRGDKASLLNAEDNFGYSLLMRAISEKKGNKIIDRLLSDATMNVDINHANDEGSTALMMAVKEDMTNFIKKLLSHKDIELDIRDKTGETAFMKAISLGKTESLKYILNTAGKNLPAIDREYAKEWVRDSHDNEEILKLLKPYLKSKSVLQKLFRH
ncbi:ankyrin repeat domain-containing protein, partial [uncultured Endozoicomonas sp.]|uniref:ankyrin repeat domain-containing protein n=1 Tax=uncultured Endozoicomonas sp. TaxID=432652 RepID=UPI002617A704